MNNLKNSKNKQKTAIITGASDGIGAAFSKLLIKNDWQVIGISRSSSKLKIIKNKKPLLLLEQVKELVLLTLNY